MKAVRKAIISSVSLIFYSSVHLLQFSVVKVQVAFIVQQGMQRFLSTDPFFPEYRVGQKLLGTGSLLRASLQTSAGEVVQAEVHRRDGGRLLTPGNLKKMETIETDADTLRRSRRHQVDYFVGRWQRMRRLCGKFVYS